MPPGLDQSWLDKSLAKQYAYNYDPAKANKILASIGYKDQNGQLIGPNGKPVSFTLEVPTGWTDWIEDASIVRQELGHLGIQVNVETPSVAADYNDVETGHFQAALVYGWNESNPYFIYDYLLSSSASAPVGQVANCKSNTERWNDPTTNQPISHWPARPCGTAASDRRPATADYLHQTSRDRPRVRRCLERVPDHHFVGWPTAHNPYANPSASWPDELLIVTHLRPRG